MPTDAHRLRERYALAETAPLQLAPLADWSDQDPLQAPLFDLGCGSPDELYDLLEAARTVAVAIGGEPEAVGGFDQALGAAVDAGLPAILWWRKGEGGVEALSELLAGAGVSDLPGAVREWRRRPGREPSLLLDDPDRPLPDAAATGPS